MVKFNEGVQTQCVFLTKECQTEKWIVSMTYVWLVYPEHLHLLSKNAHSTSGSWSYADQICQYIYIILYLDYLLLFISIFGKIIWMIRFQCFFYHFVWQFFPEAFTQSCRIATNLGASLGSQNSGLMAVDGWKFPSHFNRPNQGFHVKMSSCVWLLLQRRFHQLKKVVHMFFPWSFSSINWWFEFDGSQLLACPS